jgi:hypothetical protein
MLKFISLAVGADVTWLEVVLGVVCAMGFYAGLVLALSI